MFVLGHKQAAFVDASDRGQLPPHAYWLFGPLVVVFVPRAGMTANADVPAWLQPYRAQPASVAVIAELIEKMPIIPGLPLLRVRLRLRQRP